MERPFKVIISQANMELDVNLKDNLQCMISVGGVTKNSEVPFKEVFCFDIGVDCEPISIKFTKNNFAIATGTINVPETVGDNPEVEMSQDLKLPIENYASQASYIVASFNLTFINTKLFNGIEQQNIVPMEGFKHHAKKMEVVDKHCAGHHTHTSDLKATKNEQETKVKKTVKNDTAKRGNNSNLTGRNENSSRTHVKNKKVTKVSKTLKTTAETTKISEVRVSAAHQRSQSTVDENKDQTLTSSLTKVKNTPSLKNLNNMTSKSNNKKSSNVTSKSLLTKFNEDDACKHITKIVDKHAYEVKNVSQPELVDISDCLVLKKFEKIANMDYKGTDYMKNTESSFNNLSTENINEELNDFYTSPEKIKHKYNSVSNHISNNKNAVKNSKNKENNNEFSSSHIDSINQNSNTQKNQIDYLKMVIYNLDKKNYTMGTYSNECSQLRDEVLRANNSREELRKSLQETTQDLREESGKFLRINSELDIHNKDLLNSLKECYTTIDNFQTENNSLEIKVSHFENENSELKQKVKSSTLFKLQLEQSRNDYTEAEKRHSNALNKISTQIEVVEKEYSKVCDEKQSYVEKFKELEMTNNSLRMELISEKDRNLKMEGELDQIKKQLLISQASAELFSTIKEQRDVIAKDIDTLTMENENFMNQIENYEKDVLVKYRDVENVEHIKNMEIERLVSTLKNSDIEFNRQKSGIIFKIIYQKTIL